MFFLLPGWLITKSWLSSDSIATYLTKRLLRIASAFGVASDISYGTYLYGYPVSCSSRGRILTMAGLRR